MSSPLALALASAFGFRASFGLRVSAFGFSRSVGHLNARPLLQLVLSIHHDPLAGFEPVLNHRFPLPDLSPAPRGHLHGADLDRLVVLDDEGEGPFRSALDYRIGHHSAVRSEEHTS